MKDLQIFDYKGQEVRTITDEEGNPWFVAKNVCSVLDLSNITMSLSNLKDSQKAELSLTDIGSSQPRNTIIINESGLYKLIMRSRKPEAEEFQDWIAEKILPSIRKTGSYGIQNLSRLELAEMIVETEKERLLLKEQNQVLLPKGQYYDDVSDASNLHTMNEAAKMLGTGRTRLFKMLRDLRIIFPKSREPYQSYIDRGYFEVKERVYYSGEDKMISNTTFVTGKGMTYLYKKLEINRLF